METPPGFNLEQAIAQWRAELARQPGLTPADLRELEAHLRDGFAELQRQRLNDDEAFLLARHRVGPPLPVAAEFAKAAPARVWAPRVFWMAFGALVIQLWQTTLSLWSSALWASPSVSGGSLPDSSAGATTTISSSSSNAYILGFELPGWVGYVVLALIFLLICGGPVLLVGRWLARGKLAGLAQLISTRTRVAVLGATLFLSAFSLQLLALHHWLAQPPHALEGSDWGIVVGMNIATAMSMEYNLFTSALWPLCLIALMIWLTPRCVETKNRAVTA